MLPAIFVYDLPGNFVGLSPGKNASVYCVSGCESWKQGNYSRILGCLYGSLALILQYVEIASAKHMQYELPFPPLTL